MLIKAILTRTFLANLKQVKIFIKTLAQTHYKKLLLKVGIGNYAIQHRWQARIGLYIQQPSASRISADAEVWAIIRIGLLNDIPHAWLQNKYNPTTVKFLSIDSIQNWKVIG